MSLFAVYVLAPDARWSLMTQVFCCAMSVVVGMCVDWRTVSNVALRPLVAVALAGLGLVAGVSGAAFAVSYVTFDSVWEWSARRGCF